MNPFEKEFTPQPPTAIEVIKIFKETGESAEAIGAYSLWLKEKQKEANESKSPYSRLEMNIDIADLLIESNMLEDAYEYLDGCWEMLENELSRFPEGNVPEELASLHQKLKYITEKTG